MEILTAIKRVPETGAKVSLTDDNLDIDTTSLGFTFSPHEECAVEEGVQLVEEHGGNVTVLTLGEEEATEQLRSAIAMGADDGILLDGGDAEWGPAGTAEAIAEAVEESDTEFDLLLFGNESADAANHQVGVRVAEELGLPCVTGIKDLDVDGGTATAKREIPGGSEVYEVDLPAVITVKEGLNEPRYPSMRAKMQARKASVAQSEPDPREDDLELVELEVPETDDSPAEILGESPEAAEDVVDVLEELEVV
ncbi:electron transfer flavoprotein beta subunit/FixA family protein (plasmid) [Halobellus limi]|uniref:Electron transfer flavoprotein beta subunit/FixA family protein n=1 Tax=Halobellus limi TaxID=699433 RepID=A0A4D6H5I2_9EURY|nr:electron transfer flavoprotein subunit beta/FixA family protein [Halobellus limi]QCC49060.1 electron transfer flavoprotein beta subunit/FixA family protein [Halobellus limi]